MLNLADILEKTQKIVERQLTLFKQELSGTVPDLGEIHKKLDKKVDDAPSNGNQYVRRNRRWEVLSSNTFFAEYGVTDFFEIKEKIQDNKIVICKKENDQKMYILEKYDFTSNPMTIAFNVIYRDGDFTYITRLKVTKSSEEESIWSEDTKSLEDVLFIDCGVVPSSSYITDDPEAYNPPEGVTPTPYEDIVKAYRQGKKLILVKKSWNGEGENIWSDNYYYNLSRSEGNSTYLGLEFTSVEGCVGLKIYFDEQGNVDSSRCKYFSTNVVYNTYYEDIIREPYCELKIMNPKVIRNQILSGSFGPLTIYDNDNDKCYKLQSFRLWKDENEVEHATAQYVNEHWKSDDSSLYYTVLTGVWDSDTMTPTQSVWTSREFTVPMSVNPD